MAVERLQAAEMTFKSHSKPSVITQPGVDVEHLLVLYSKHVCYHFPHG